ncbi:putative ankyrin repeat-containing protein [Diaporthe ampelina]|uniref:Putative ankyrin repeat-containing protein n=1 Tax=Diaporthe ampelina TaxID=1214573 RepID=A0A0G2FJJ0_9PEZI|nr:putative ankyrin repeat-containing protein [Diaporthe ampelina]
MHVSQTGHAQATPVPIYTETDEKGFSARLKTFQNSHPKYPIVPVTKHPGTPNCPSATGETPLLASIRARSAPTARTLLALGADANLFGRASAAAEPGAATTPTSSSSSSDDDDDDDDDLADRTPLMLAAATGQLATVRVLVEEFAADDAVVGPRGETALRLAAGAGHRDVVRFFAAVVARLRDIKLKDVGHDLLVALEALFVRLPRAVWAVMCQFGVVAGRAIRACFTGYCIRALFRFFGILPKALWSILQSLWASFRRGVDELITLVNPKRVSSGASRS